MSDASPKKGEAIFAPELPVEVGDRGWWSRVVRTLALILVRPRRAFSIVQEPVRHGPALSFIASVRLPTWGVLVLVSLVDWYSLPTDVEAPIQVTAATRLLGLQLGQVISAASLIAIPLRIPILYFAAGLTGHIVMTLTGGAHRSIGASMRALGYALAPVTLVAGVLELLVNRGMVSPEIWLYTWGAALCVGWVCAGIALSRTHSTSIVRGIVVALIPVILAGGDAYLGAMMHLPWDPFTGPPPPADYLVPLPPP